MNVIISHEQLREEIRKNCGLTFKTTTPLPACEWIEKYIKIPDYSPRPGDYSVDYTPFWRGIYGWYDDPEVTRISLQKGVQISGTQGIQNLKLYSIANERMPQMYVGQTEKDVAKYVSTRLEPMIEECPSIKDLMVRGGKNTNTQKDFKTATMFIAWPTVNALASSSVGRGFFDEINKWAHIKKTEAHPYDLAWKRLTAFLKVGIKVVETSTPTDELGLITKAFKAGSQHLYNVPCWKCERPFVHHFSKETVWVPPESKRADGSYDLDMIEKETRYVCPHCKEKISDNYRDRMILAGEWKQTNFQAPKDHRSAHISGFISPTITYGKMAREFFEKKGTANGLRDHYNNYQGLPFTPKAVTNSGETIKKLIEKTPVTYKRGELPFEPYTIITTVDVQQRSFWFIKMAYDSLGNVWIIDWGELPSYQSIIDEIEKPHAFEGVDYYSNGGLIDSGYEAKRENGVYAFCQKSNRRFHPVKGWADSVSRFKTVEFKDFDHNGLPIRLYNINDGFFKSELYGTRMKGFSKEMLCLPVDPDNELIDQLTDERLISVLGRMVWESEDPSNPNNHLGDCAKYNLAAWSHINPNAPKKEKD